MLLNADSARPCHKLSCTFVTLRTDSSFAAWIRIETETIPPPRPRLSAGPLRCHSVSRQSTLLAAVLFLTRRLGIGPWANPRDSFRFLRLSLSAGRLLA